MMSNLNSAPASQILVVVELLLQLKRLVPRVRLSAAFPFDYSVLFFFSFYLV